MSHCGNCEKLRDKMSTYRDKAERLSREVQSLVAEMEAFRCALRIMLHVTEKTSAIPEIPGSVDISKEALRRILDGFVVIDSKSLHQIRMDAIGLFPDWHEPLAVAKCRESK